MILAGKIKNKIKRYNSIKYPHRYAVQVSDTTMMTNAASLPGQKLNYVFYTLLGIIPRGIGYHLAAAGKDANHIFKLDLPSKIGF